MKRKMLQTMVLSFSLSGVMAVASILLPITCTAQDADLNENSEVPTYDPNDPVNYGLVPRGWTGDKPPVVPCELSKAVQTIWEVQPTMPDRIIFKIHPYLDPPVEADDPTSWTYTIVESEKIAEIVEAMKNINQVYFGDFGGGPHHDYSYFIKFAYEGSDQNVRRTIQDITFNLTHEIPLFYNYSNLENSLKCYPPGFKAQEGYIYRAKQ